MQKDELELAVREIAANRFQMQKQLLDFAQTDLLFFFSDKPEVRVWQQQKWQPIIKWCEDRLGVEIKVTTDLMVPDNDDFINSLAKVFDNVTDKEFCCWYAAALNLRSVLLALALVKRKINAQQASELACLEELWQNEQWGEDEWAVASRKSKAEELSEIESFLLCEM